MKHLLALVTVAAGFGLTAVPALAAAPPNDDFADAIALTAGTTVPVDTVEATSQVDEPDNAGTTPSSCLAIDTRPDCGSTVWFTFTAPDTASYVIDTCDDAFGPDTVLDVFTGSTLTGLSFAGSNDDGPDSATRPCGNGSSVTLAATAGTTYRVRLAGYGAAGETAYLSAYPIGAVPPGQPTAAVFARQSSIAADPGFSVVGSGARRTASFAWATTPAGTSSECSLDDAAFTACTSPVSYAGVGEGADHRFRVRAAGDATPTVQRFHIDRSPPDTSVLSGPAEGASVTLPADFETTTEDPVNARASDGSCSLDEIAFSLCSVSGSAFRLDPPLCNGSHVAKLARFDNAGNLDPTPVARTFSTTGNADCSAAAPAIGAPTVSYTNNSTTAAVSAPIDDGGRYAELTLEIGPTTAYGSGLIGNLPPRSSAQSESISARVTPGETYHYRLSVRTATGTRTTPDATFTAPTTVAGTAVQQVTPGTPQPAGPNALTIPVTVVNGTPSRSVKVSAIVARAPISVLGKSFTHAASTDVPADATGPTSVGIPLIDVEPGETLHYRVMSNDGAAGSARKFTTSPDLTFVVPVLPVVTPGPGNGTATPGPSGTPAPTVTPPPVITPPAFKLTKGLVTVGRATRRAKRLKVTVRSVPAGAALSVTAKGKQALAKATGKPAAKAGTRTLTLRFGKKARKALRRKRLKALRITVAVTPAGGTRQSVTRAVKLKRK